MWPRLGVRRGMRHGGGTYRSDRHHVPRRGGLRARSAGDAAQEAPRRRNRSHRVRLFAPTMGAWSSCNEEAMLASAIDASSTNSAPVRVVTVAWPSSTDRTPADESTGPSASRRMAHCPAPSAGNSSALVGLVEERSEDSGGRGSASAGPGCPGGDAENSDASSESPSRIDGRSAGLPGDRSVVEDVVNSAASSARPSLIEGRSGKVPGGGRAAKRGISSSRRRNPSRSARKSSSALAARRSAAARPARASSAICRSRSTCSRSNATSALRCRISLAGDGEARRDIASWPDFDRLARWQISAARSQASRGT